MKVQIDENQPPALVKAIAAIAGRVDGHEVIHVNDYARGSGDLELFRRALAAGVQVHITQDHHNRHPVEKEAIARLGLTVFVLAAGWDALGLYAKAALLIEWWPKLMQVAEATEPGSMFRVPACSSRRGRLKPLQRRR